MLLGSLLALCIEGAHFAVPSFPSLLFYCACLVKDQRTKKVDWIMRKQDSGIFSRGRRRSRRRRRKLNWWEILCRSIVLWQGERCMGTVRYSRAPSHAINRDKNLPFISKYENYRESRNAMEMHKVLEKDFSRKDQREEGENLYNLEIRQMGSGGRWGSRLDFAPYQLASSVHL